MAFVIAVAAAAAVEKMTSFLTHPIHTRPFTAIKRCKIMTHKTGAERCKRTFIYAKNKVQ